jgi:hypothetical protein
MAWLKLHAELPRHPKTTRLARTLGVSRAEAVGHLIMLWTWAFEFADDGDLSGFYAEDIAEAAGIDNGQGPSFFKALKDCGWVDADHHLHDWMDYAGPYLREQNRSRERAANGRARRGSTAAEPRQYRKSAEGKSKSKSKREIQEKEQRATVESSDSTEVVLSGTVDDGFDDFWKAYPNKQGKVVSQKHWKGMKTAQREAATVVAAAMAYCVSEGHRDLDKCPHGSTFLNQRRWEEWYNEEGELRAPPGYGPTQDDAAASIARVLARHANDPEEEW